MSQENKLPDENAGNDQSKENKKSLLEYYLIPQKHALSFNIAKQHESVVKFLDDEPGGKWRHPNTGICVTLGPSHPEIVFSGKFGNGVEIRLDGTGGRAIEKGHVDITRFGPAENEIYRNGARNMIMTTLNDFIRAVEKSNKNFEAVVVKTRNQDGKKIVLQ